MKCYSKDIFRSVKLKDLTSNEENTIFVNESGLYSLILLYNKKEPKLLKKKLVTSEVFLLLETQVNINYKM